MQRSRESRDPPVSGLRSGSVGPGFRRDDGFEYALKCEDSGRRATIRVRIGEEIMKRSTDRILTTHVGSLPRPDDLRALILQKQQGQAVDEAAFTARVKSA